MEIRVCPVCDQKMSSAHYCKTCRRYVRHPFIRKVNYYLNEQGPRVSESSIEPQRNVPVQPMQNRNTPISTGQNQWQPVKPSGHDDKRVPIVLLAAVIIGIFFVAGFLAIAFELRRDHSSVSVESFIFGDDSAEYTDELGLEEMVEDYEELDADEVREAGAACSSYGHFHTTGYEMEDVLFELIAEEEFIIEERQEYSYNERYSDGTTWFSNGVYFYLESDTEEVYPMLGLDYDTATDALHEVDLILEDPEKIVEITEYVLNYLIDNDDFVPDPAAVEAIKTGLLESFENDEEFTYLIEDVGVYGYVYEGVYVVYIVSEIE